MSENLLQFIWMHRLYDAHLQLKTIDGNEVHIVYPGIWNKNAGPDFLEAKIKIGDTLWVGNIELHIKSSDWNKHSHQQDERFTKLILHIVYEYDKDIETKDGTTFPTLALKPFIDTQLLTRYAHLMETKQWIPCSDQIKQVSALTIHQQLTRTLTERLENKMLSCNQLLKQYNNNWQEVFYIQLARGFGLHINQDAFEQLALRTPLSLISKLKNNPLQVEALLFGQGGFLFDYFDEPYPLALQKEYTYLQKAYHLTPLAKQQWKFLRLRPANFPTIRIAQLAKLICTSQHLFSTLIESVAIKEMEILLSVKLESYWINHYNFEEKSVSRSKSLGKAFVQTLIINVVIPMMFIYGKLQGNEMYCDKAILFLEQIPPEHNSILAGWKEIGLNISSAADTQALLQLKNVYCDAKQCLRCSIGYAIIS